MKIGEFNELVLDRKTDIGYILTNGKDEVFLHNNDMNGLTPEVGENLNAFVYYDKQGRVTATLYEAKITTHVSDWVEVVEVIRDGVFVNIGIRNDMFISKDEMPHFKELWPEKGDLLYCYLYENKNRLQAGISSKDDFLDIAKVAPQMINGEELQGRVIATGKVGTHIYTEQGFLAFIHESQRRAEPRLGSIVKGRVINVKDDGTLNMSLIPQKENVLEADAQLIWDTIPKYNGKLPLCDKSSSDDIKEILNISKSSFKRAVGILLKENRIEQDKEKCYIQKSLK